MFLTPALLYPQVHRFGLVVPLWGMGRGRRTLPFGALRALLWLTGIRRAAAFYSYAPRPLRLHAGSTGGAMQSMAGVQEGPSSGVTLIKGAFPGSKEAFADLNARGLTHQVRSSVEEAGIQILCRYLHSSIQVTRRVFDWLSCARRCPFRLWAPYDTVSAWQLTWADGPGSSYPPHEHGHTEVRKK
jgi:hypothetical protein